MTSPSSKPRPTIYDVAREAGVSKSLVSLVLNNSPLVAEAKREAVRDAIRKLGYRRSQAASSLASNRTRTIGLVIDDFRNPWFVELLNGLRTTMGPHGFHVAVREHFTLGSTTMNAIDGFRDTQVDALVVAAEPGRDFEDLGIPTVLEGTRCNTIEGADLIGSDQAQGGDDPETIRGGHEYVGHPSPEFQGKAYQPSAVSLRVLGVSEDHETAGSHRPSGRLDLPDQVTSVLVQPVKVRAGAELHTILRDPQDDTGLRRMETETDPGHAEKVFVGVAAQDCFENVHIIVMGAGGPDPPFLAAPSRLLTSSTGMV